MNLHLLRQHYDSKDRISNLPLQIYDNQRRVKELIDMDELNGEDKKGIDVPFFDFEIVLKATDHFSEANRLGKGGFGPVYKVVYILLNIFYLVSNDKYIHL